uniref:Leucine-rich repeat-containing protein 40 n=1 Tax=Macrostomum lignano TaxID=282301 RepID=A0A1I8GUG4_9PLAT
MTSPKASALPGGPAGPAEGFNDNVPNGLLKTAKQTGVLNLSNKDLSHVPDKVWQLANSADASQPTSHWTDPGQRAALVGGCRADEALPVSQQAGVSVRVHRQVSHLAVVDVRDNRLIRLPDAVGQLAELRSLNASKNRLIELPPSLASSGSLVQLSPTACPNVELPPDIGRLDSLSELDIADNQLTGLPDSIAMLRCLRCLEAGGNRIDSLPAGVAHLPALSRLGLAGNRLEHLPGGPYPALEVLDLSDNQLTDLPPIGADPDSPAKLKELHLVNNRISRLLPDRLRPLGVSLRHLDLKRNCLSELPVELAGLLPLLERLDLTNNDLSSLPNELGLLTGLKCILLDGNPLRALRREVVARGTEAIKKHLASRIAQPAAAEAAVDAAAAVAAAAAAAVASGGSATEVAAAASACSKKISKKDPAPKTALQALQQQFGLDLGELRVTGSLKYADKRVAEVPEPLLELLANNSETGVSVTRIDLSGNELAGLPERLAKPPFADSLLEVSLRKNCLVGQLDAGVAQLASLTVLDLSVNQLTSLPMEVSQLKQLQNLVLSYNRIAEFPEPLYSLPRLETVLLANNCIATLQPDRLRGMSSLATLDLTNNSLATVPPQLGLCTNLRNLHLEGNRFRVPRPDQLAKGTAFVLEYLRNRIAADDFACVEFRGDDLAVEFFWLFTKCCATVVWARPVVPGSVQCDVGWGGVRAAGQLP